MVKGKKGLPARSASLSCNPTRMAVTRWEESKASTTDKVIRLITPTKREAVAVMVGETVYETAYFSVPYDDPRAKGFMWIVTLSEHTLVFIKVIKGNDCQLPGCNHFLHW
jgi:hypothetical protein